MPKRAPIRPPILKRRSSPRIRSQEQIRHGLYLKLGLLNNTPQHTAAKRSLPEQPKLPSCLRKQTRSALHASEERNISFFEQVVVRNIPSHRDLDEETWRTLYHDPETVKKDMRRNKYEFWVDGGNWRRATEEDEFFENTETGELVHPASWSLMSNLAYQCRLSFMGSDSDDEDPTSVTEVDAPRAAKCPYKRNSKQYGYPHHPSSHRVRPHRRRRAHQYNRVGLVQA